MMRHLCFTVVLCACCLFSASAAAGAADVAWQVDYDAKTVPAAPTWLVKGTPQATVTAEGLHLRDESVDTDGCYRAAWTADPEMEVVVEATLKVNATTGANKAKPASLSVWPWRDGAPVSLLVSDGKHQDGLVFYGNRVTTYTDRSIIMDTTKAFHTFRLVIRGNDMSVAVDGEVKVKGQGAFQRLAPSAERFLQIGSSAKYPTGDAVWKSVKLGVRKPTAPVAPVPVKLTISKPWPITHPGLTMHKPTRPYVYNVGDGKLLMSIAEGPDATHEPYGILRSDDEGKTWTPIKELDQTPNAPLPMTRLKNGSVLGASRWTWVQPDRSLIGKSVRWTPDLSRSEMYESRLRMPMEYASEKTPFTVERRLFEEADGSLLLSGYSKTGPSTPEGVRAGRRFSHLVKSTDAGKTWNHYSVVGPGGEPAVMKTGEGKMTALGRTGPFLPFTQTFSEDGGKTWSEPVLLEEGSVCADLVMMSNGLLACSYGRPANMLMFSADGGKTWASHHLISDRTGFNYSGIAEVKPGRLLYVHDAGGLQALTIDIERVDR